MKEVIVEYGTTHPAIIVSSSKTVIAVKATDIGEGFILVGHGIAIEDLPQVGQEGKIIFEKDKNKGHWQWYADVKQNVTA